MFGNFYNSSIRNYTLLMSELFGHIQIKRRRKDGDKYIKVPISYLSKEHFVQKLMNAFNTNSEDKNQIAKIDTILPRLSLQLVDILYDETMKTSIHNRQSRTGRDGKLTAQFNPVPVKLTYQLSIYTRHEDDMFQIIEQIFPYFQPNFNCHIKELHNNEVIIERVVPVNLMSFLMDEQLEGDRFSMRRLESTFTFELQGWLYPAINHIKGQIKTVYLDFTAVEKTVDDERVLDENVDFQVAPEEVSEEDWDGSYITGYGQGEKIPTEPEKPHPRGDLSNGQIGK